MASTQAGETSGVPERRTRFVAPSASSPEGSDTPEWTELAGGLRKCTLAADASMGVGAPLCFVLSAGISGGQGAVSDTAAPEISSLLEQIRIIEVKTAALPEAYDAERGLTAALTAAGQVAELQNDYRHLTPGAAADGGRLDTVLSHSTLRNLTPPYFAPFGTPGGPGAVVPARQRQGRGGRRRDPKELQIGLRVACPGASPGQ